MENPLITVITPTWNRGKYIQRVWNGLRKQTYKNIEWIVCDDGSEDETILKLKEIKKLTKFKMIILHAKKRVGKTRLDNAAINMATGEFIVWNDSDDYFLEDGIEKLVSTWLKIPDLDKKMYIGITAQCKDIEGKIITNPPIMKSFDTTWNDLREELKYTGDLVYFTRSSVIKKNLFPEVDFVIPEGVVWTKLGKEKIKVIQDVVKIVEYKADNCISFSGKMEYCRGKAYAIPIIKNNLSQYNNKFIKDIWQTITYIRYSIHGEIRLKEIINLSEGSILKRNIYLFYFISMILVIVDQCRNKVIKTHIEFNKSRRIEIQKIDS